MSDPNIAPPALAAWTVPGISDDAPHVRLEALPGQVTCLVGANGAGKSALGAWLDQTAQGAAVHRIIAHRQLWFESAGPDITASQRPGVEQNSQMWAKQVSSRYVDRNSSQRVGTTLFDLLAREGEENRLRLRLHERGAGLEAVDQQLGRKVLERLNSVMELAGLGVRLEITGGQLLNARNVHNGASYPSFQMSDGEKSAMLLAADVLTAPAGVLIIDEPERHLHRAISAALVEAVVDERPDCHFIVLTHDLELTARLADHAGDTYAVTGVRWVGEAAQGWDLELVDEEGISDAARTAILGGRSRIVFIEGRPTSPDLPTYQALYPGFALQPTGGADQVIHAVTGLRDSGRHHWVHARGIVDGDARTEGERDDLAARGVLALGVSEVENIYYLDCIIDALAHVQASALGLDADTLRVAARSNALAALGAADTLQRLVGELARTAARRDLQAKLPPDLVVSDNDITLTVTPRYSTLLADAQARLASADLQGLVKQLPIRGSQLRPRVATALHYANAGDYERAARTRIRTDTALAGQVRTVTGTLPD